MTAPSDTMAALVPLRYARRARRVLRFALMRGKARAWADLPRPHPGLRLYLFADHEHWSLVFATTEDAARQAVTDLYAQHLTTDFSLEAVEALEHALANVLRLLKRRKRELQAHNAWLDHPKGVAIPVSWGIDHLEEDELPRGDDAEIVRSSMFDGFPLWEHYHNEEHDFTRRLIDTFVPHLAIPVTNAEPTWRAVESLLWDMKSHLKEDHSCLDSCIGNLGTHEGESE